MEQCNNYTWVLTAVAQGGKSRDVQGGRFVGGVFKNSVHFVCFCLGQVNVPCPGEPLLQPQGDPFLSAEDLLQQVRHVMSATNLNTSTLNTSTE